jgi:hypothetical protein
LSVRLSSPAASPPGPNRAAPPGHVRATEPQVLLLAGAFLCVVAIGMWHHEMWGDEWQAWLIARDSRSVWDLLGQLRYEGHLPGWHLILFVLSRFTRNVVVMQAVHLALATGAIYLLARFAPLPWAMKVVAAFGYFLAYEYAVIARHYALAVLALFAFCAIFPLRGRYPIGTVVALVVLASTSVYGVILAAAAAGMWLLAGATDPAGDSSANRRRLVARVGLLAWIGLGLVALTLALLRPIDALTGVPGASGGAVLSRWALASTVAELTAVYLPIPDLTSLYWGSHILGAADRLGLGVRFALAVGIVGASSLLFLRTPPVLLFFLAGTGGILLFNHLVFSGFLRHHGHLFVLFLACLWLAREVGPEWHPPWSLAHWTGARAPWASAFLTVLLLIQVAAAAILYVADIRRPFSVSAAVASFVSEQQLDHLPIAVAPAHTGIPIAGALDRPIHYLAVGASGTFVPWGRYVRGRDRIVSMGLLRPFLDAHDFDALVILGATMDDWDEDLEVEELARFSPGLIRNETFVVYRVRGIER